jgi:hypothetical protein
MEPAGARGADERLEERLMRLEAVVEGLQDAVDRAFRRFDALIDALQRKTEPAEIAKALGEDARRRGL